MPFLPLPDAAALKAAWDRDVTTIEQRTGVPVDLEADDFAILAEGEPISHRVDTANGAVATGAIWIPAPMDDVWVSIQDAPHEPPSAVHANWITPASATGRDCYMKLDLPWPMSDRQWVSDIRTNTDLFAATGGRICSAPGSSAITR